MAKGVNKPMYRKARKFYRDPLAFFLDSNKKPLWKAGERMFIRQTRRFKELGAKHSNLKISVVMTVYNTGALVDDAVLSVLSQSHKNIELMIIDDASTDDTLQRLKALKKTDDRIRLFHSPTNHGTYWSKNWAIRNATGDFIATHDSDDTSAPRRLQIQLGALMERPKAAACTVRWRRVNTKGEELDIDGRRERMAAISLMFRRNMVLEKTGYYDSVRISADTEFITRLEHVFGKASVRHLRHHLYTGLLRDGSLTRGAGSGFSWEADGNSFRRELSGDRADYHKAFHAWHNAYPGNEDTLKIDFPQQDRTIAAAEDIRRNCDDQDISQVQEIL